MQKRLSPKAPRPQARVLRNDKRILDASISLLAKEGWGSFNVASVAREAGLSHPAVKERFPTRHIAAERIWSNGIGDAIAEQMSAILEAAHERTDHETVHDALQDWTYPNDTLQTAAELLVVAHHDDHLNEAVQGDLGHTIKKACTPGANLTPTLAAQRGYLAIVALGLLLMAYRIRRSGFDFLRETESVTDALNHPADPTELPRLPGQRTIENIDFGTGDDLHDDLLTATLKLTAERGFHDVTVDDIAAEIGVTKGFIFSRYDSKLNLFMEASKRQRAVSLHRNLEKMKQIAHTGGNAIAEAAAMRDLQRPKYHGLRSLNLEQLQLTWHDRDAATTEEERLVGVFEEEYATRRPDATPEHVRAHVHVARALGVGLALFPLLLPVAHRLPYDVMTVPLHELPSTTN